MTPEHALLVERLGDLVSRMSMTELEAEIASPSHLLLNRAFQGKKTIETAWAPFDHVNRDAAVAIVGITPGRQQMRNALLAYKAARREGYQHNAALALAKVHASFSGSMRNLLIQMLDHVGLNTWLGLASSAALWDTRQDLAHFTSALRYPVFVDGGNYSGSSPRMLKSPALRPTIDTLLAREIAALPSHAIIVPLGSKVEEALRYVAAHSPGFDERRVLWGLPHPSPANQGEINPFLELPPNPGRTRPVPASIAERREALRRQISLLPPRPRDLAA